MAKGLCDALVDSNIVLPVIIYHDAGRYKTPEGVTKIDHASFTQRLLHMFEGQRLVEKHMTEQGYDKDQVTLASKIVAVHDWPYLRQFTPEEELNKSNPKIDFEGKELYLAEIYETLLRIAESGVLNTPEFVAYRDADRLNAPAVASFAKDYLSRANYFDNFSPLEFVLLRYAYFDLLGTAAFSGEVSPERRDYVKSKAKVEPVTSSSAVRAVKDILQERFKDVTTGYLDLKEPMSNEQFREIIRKSLDQEMSYCRNFAQRE